MTAAALLAPATLAHAIPFPRTVAFYLPSLAGGGAERVTLMLIRELLGRGASVKLLLSNAVGPLAREIPPGCEVIRFGTRRTALDLPHLIRFLRAHRPDVLVAAMNHNNIAALLAKLVLARSGHRVVISMHNALSAETGAGNARGYRVLPWCYRALAAAADGIVAVSAGVADDMATTTGVDRNSIRVLHNPVIDNAFAARAAADADHPWARDQNIPLFVTAGRLAPQKDHATLLHAIALRLERGPARLLILGEGPERGALERLAAALGIAEHVAFPGFRDNPLPYIRAAAAFVLSSRFEGFGNVLVEAMACGTPVISTNCPHGPSEILADGEYGVLTPVGDAAALAAAMSCDLRAQWPARFLQARAEQFGCARVADGYIALFEAVLAGHGRRSPLERAA